MLADKGNVVIRAGTCVLTLMPDLGGKISSIRVGEHELLQAPIAPYAARSRKIDFSESDASGWDECLPSVAPCLIDLQAGEAEIPDHGDLWRIPWQVLDAADDSVTMRAKCFWLPLELTRTLHLSATDSAWTLDFLYSLTNLGAYDTPWSWSAHPLFAVESGDRILLPEHVSTLRLEGSFRQRLGVAGATVHWPLEKSPDGRQMDLSQVQGIDSEIGDKLFAGPFVPGSDQMGCTLERRSAGLKISVFLDAAATPFLGLWICYGGWPEGPGPKQFCVAMEPCTAPVDSLAEAGEWKRSLESGETYNWTMRFRVERL